MDTDTLSPRARDRLREILTTRQAREGGILTRPAADIDRVVGRAAFLAEMRRLGFPVVRSGSSYVVFCAGGELERLC